MLKRLWTDRRLASHIRKLGPWHHDIQLTETLSTGLVFSKDRSLLRAENGGVSLISPGTAFNSLVEKLFDKSLTGKRFLDCACNAGAYCFLARKYNADFVFGFDVREHWINQARFVQKVCRVQPTDNIQLEICDLYNVPERKLDSFDFTYFSGIFYHLPGPISGLKIAADLTKDILLVNTACAKPGNSPMGMTMKTEGVDPVMSGVHEMAWNPNGPEVVAQILLWLGFKDIKLTFDVDDSKNAGRRIQLIAGREKNRLDRLYGARYKRCDDKQGEPEFFDDPKPQVY